MRVPKLLRRRTLLVNHGLIFGVKCRSTLLHGVFRAIVPNGTWLTFTRKKLGSLLLLVTRSLSLFRWMVFLTVRTVMFIFISHVLRSLMWCRARGRLFLIWSRLCLFPFGRYPLLERTSLVLIRCVIRRSFGRSIRTRVLIRSHPVIASRLLVLLVVIMTPFLTFILLLVLLALKIRSFMLVITLLIPLGRWTSWRTLLLRWFSGADEKSRKVRKIAHRSAAFSLFLVLFTGIMVLSKEMRVLLRVFPVAGNIAVFIVLKMFVKGTKRT